MSLYKLISPKSLADLVRKETSRRVVPVDSTWYMPNTKKDGKQEFLDVERIANAVYFDIDGVKDHSSPYPHMLPDLATFNAGMSQLGITSSDILVVYDRIGNFSAPRCAWTLAVFGHQPVYLLNNFIAYKQQGLPLDTSKRTAVSPFQPSTYESNVDLTSQEVVSYEDMLKLVESGELALKYNVFDARALPRFTGEASEPRPGLPSGHVPGTQPLPYSAVLSEGCFEDSPEKMQKRLQDYLESANCTLDSRKPTIAMCGTGVSGVIIKTALELAGVKDVKLYDGSWTEWAMRADPKYLAKGRK
ncbi:LANO_0H16160g1_1 [Lachancea nothofagi CBS 11611]|uniref:Sulfurtransferase n=1 Tax=Lachancea nothofagi CBS 11611 TaxID=1266666 RepID=A0A1G4KMX3_9SACH|nr:LANO_0H16160g1_1 [Lachancea nothofagi CBS 11611]